MREAESAGIQRTGGRLVSIRKCHIPSDADHHAEHDDLLGGVFSCPDCSGSIVSSDPAPALGKNKYQSRLVWTGATNFLMAQRHSVRRKYYVACELRDESN